MIAKLLRSIYNLAIYTYYQLVKVAALKNQKAALLLAGQRSVFKHIEECRDSEGGYIWFHAASLGEFEQGRPLMEAMKANDPSCKILLTFFSPSGYEVRKNYAGADLVAYLPFDTPKRVAQFLDLVKPKQAIFIKYEFWANYLIELSQRNIPLYIVSAIFRPQQVFFKWYGHFFRQLLRRFTLIFVQNEHSKQLLAERRITKVVVAGDTRFDRVIDILEATKEIPLAQTFAQDTTTLVAGSSWPADEDILLDYINQHPNLKLIIAPHEIHEGHLAQIEQKLQRPSVRYTQATPQTVVEADCLIMDCFGLLSSIYRYGQIAYIGGGFGVGIHNITEAAVYGIPVLFGPNHAKFREATDLVTLKGASCCSCGEELHSTLDKLLNDIELREQQGAIAGNYITQNAGATAIILQQLGK